MNAINRACAYAFVHGSAALKNMGRKLKQRIEEVKNDESGMEIIAIILIIIVIIALVVIFRSYIIEFIQKLWNRIFGDAGLDSPDTYGDEDRKNTKFAFLYSYCHR